MSLCRTSTVVWFAFFINLMITGANAARLADAQLQQLQDPLEPKQQLRRNELLTYYFDASKPQVSLGDHGTGRPGRTALSLTLSQPSISTYMPVVSPRASGMTHQVSKTWEVLKHLSTMFECVKALNAAQPSQPRLFPRGSLAIEAAADNTPAKVDINAVITAAEALGKPDIWAETSPGSLLLLPTGQSTAAVADLMDVTYNSKTGLMSLHVELVHNPDTISEFHPHGKQSLASDEAHYHFSTTPGVKVDAAALMKSLQDDNYQVDGMHVFLKGNPAPECVVVTMNPSGCAAGTVANGTEFNVTVTVDPRACTNKSFGAAPYVGAFAGGDVALITNARVGSARGAVKPPRTNNGERALASANAILNVQGGIGTATFRVQTGTSGGPFVVGLVIIWSPDRQMDFEGRLKNLAVFNCAQPPPPAIGSLVSKLLLLPGKAYRHIHDPITVTALALDANKAPIANASVVLAVYGDCDPWVSQTNYTTDAAGQATFTIKSMKPGALSVVAAMVDSNGLPVVSYPAHIIYFDEHSYIDEREEQYYGHGHGDHKHGGHGDGGYQGDEDQEHGNGAGYKGGDLDDDKGYSSDAESYAAAAKKAALQQIRAKAVTQRT